MCKTLLRFAAAILALFLLFTPAKAGAATKLSAPTLTQPAQGVVMASSKVKVAWRKVSGAKKYQIAMWIVGPNKVKATGWLSGTSQSVTFSVRDVTIGLKVRARDSKGKSGPWSAVRYFSLRKQACVAYVDPATVQSPASGLNGSAQVFTFQLANCTWSLATDVDWIVPLGGPFGPNFWNAGTRKLDYVVRQNTTAQDREGHIYVDDKKITVKQKAGTAVTPPVVNVVGTWKLCFDTRCQTEPATKHWTLYLNQDKSMLIRTGNYLNSGYGPEETYSGYWSLQGTNIKMDYRDLYYESYLHCSGGCWVHYSGQAVSGTKLTGELVYSFMNGKGSWTAYIPGK